MSLIHEALKKAEAQRHLGEAPTLNSPAFARRRRRRWLLPVVLLAIVLGGAYLAWSFWPQHQDSPANVVKVAAHTAPGTPSPKVPDDGNKPAAATHAAGPAKTPPRKIPASLNKARNKHPTAAVNRTPADSTQKKTSAPVVRHQPKRKATVAPPPKAPIKPLSKPAATKKPVAAPAAPATAATSGLPLYWQLPYAERKDLPELKISMHVYARSPADRFVIINGARQVQGDDLGNNMTLVAIRPDGIVVELNGKRFVVPTAGAQ